MQYLNFYNFTQYVVCMTSNQSEIFISLRDELSELKEFIDSNSKKKLNKVIRTIDSNLKLEEDWEQFYSYFNQVHKDFTDNLQNKFPDLTSKDLKFCTLIRLNLSTKEISNIMNLSVRTIEGAKYRLRKKLNIEKEASLVKYLSGF
jgi:DNA-binding CsgD family transcriptional regulator